MIKKNKKLDKEYIKFENGKVISVEENNTNNKQLHSSSYPKPSSIEDINKKSNLEKIKNLLKPILIISLFVGGYFIINDIHKDFYDVPKQTLNNQSTTNIKETTINNKNESSKSDVVKNSSIYSDINYLIEADLKITNISADNINYIKSYIKQSINYPTLYDQICLSINTEETMLKELESKDTYFAKNGLESFTNILKQRISIAIIMDKEIKSTLDEIKGTPSLIESVNKYIEKEIELKTIQNNNFIKLLNEKQIKYNIENENIILEDN